MKTIHDFKALIESKLDIMNCLDIREDKIIPNTEILNKKVIRDNHWDDLFSYHGGKLVFTNRFMTFVGEITDRQVLTGHYFFNIKRGLK